MNTSLTAPELYALLESGSVCLIDVLLPEVFACRHIAGAMNACVYEMVFLDRIAECVPDRTTAVVVYDESGTTLAARTAREKLERAGYREVAVLEGGLRGWEAAGFSVESLLPLQPAAVVHDGVYRVDTEKSVLEWTGRNINNRHYGRIGITSGEVVMVDGRPVSGRFTVDMTTISNLDLQDEGWRGMLLRHLKSDDFFDVERFPAAAFEVRSATEIGGTAPGRPNMEIAGALTIKDTTRPIRFPAIIVMHEDGSIKAQAAFDLDRTNWNVQYGSGKLFERLGMHLVNDMVSIELFVVAREVVGAE